MDEDVEHRAIDRVGVHPLAHREVPLRIEVDHEDAMPLLVERNTEVERGRRLRDAALLVREDDDVRHQRALCLGSRGRRRDGLEARGLVGDGDGLLLDRFGDGLGTRLESRKEA